MPETDNWTRTVANTRILIAETEGDFVAARALGFEWARSHLVDFPEHQSLIEKFFDPDAYKETMENLHIIHARPKGAVLLAELEGRPVGCVMYQEMEPGVAEIKRLFVASSARGHGLGKTLLTEMFRRMKADRYATVRFSSAKFLEHARALYESVGFRDIEQPGNLPDYLRDFVYFMERPL
jgi:ribosomal protein S18 acetylase RimI-like enzyme